MAKKRAFVRYSKQGKIVPGSLILTGGSHPNGPSTWKEVPADLCCEEPIPTGCCTLSSGIIKTKPYPDPNNLFAEPEDVEDTFVIECGNQAGYTGVRLPGLVSFLNFQGATIDNLVLFANNHLSFLGVFSVDNGNRVKLIMCECFANYYLSFCPTPVNMFFTGETAGEIYVP